ncbi:Na+-transporting NADH:ubiquinone oxidoreductase subunit A [Saccharicrinis carchari]|uniref:Na(+)-translocating NADH-quinone reductase subunit A n=1 Tax=Saccharicrinis carchari TaxID=1168039 RepID=A0A521D0M5_SACCC|nr:Na(+)-translocating NADH-quinone reductase subunit A [Saccharicrinis carchari]SMO65243.1 Na+-transporting NADH:ubiquinone oxidoreductase subunit A [Saccharicrinis carchari]
MSDVIKIKKGLDIRLEGKAETVFGAVKLPELFAVKPGDFPGLVPKLAVKPGDKVKVGSVLFYDKYRTDIKFVSPVSGEVTLVNRGERRRILEVVVKSDNQNEAEEFGAVDPKQVSKEEAIKKMKAAGMWPFLRQRPYNIIANAEDEPKGIFISAFDSAPLAPDYDFIVSGQEKEFQAGVDVLNKLTPGGVHIGVNQQMASKLFLSTQGVTRHSFSGPHPAGNVGVQIHHVSPINKGELCWTIQPQEVISLGKLFLEGTYDASRVIALTGSELKNRNYVRTKVGANIAPYVANNVSEGNLRYISGNVLTGTNIGKDGYLGSYHAQFTVIPEGDKSEFMGWAAPGLDKFSLSRTFFTWLSGKKQYVLDANLNGGKRAIIVSGEYNKVLPMDIMPEQLIKAIITVDIDKMEQLGIYEVVEEDLALCEFVCTSKLEIQSILRKGLDVMIKEMS